MSIASGYSVDLYCDCEDCLASHTHREYQGGRGEYVGENWTECKQQAIGDGWSISQDRSVCYAPGHKRPWKSRKKGG